MHTNSKDNTFMQRRLLIEKAQTALDIFRFAHMVLIYMCRSILVDLCRACFVDTRCSKRFNISSQDSVYSIFNPISLGVSILLLQGLPSLPRLPKVFGKVLFLTPYYHGQTFNLGFSIEGDRGRDTELWKQFPPPP